MDSDRHSTARVFISATTGDLGSLRKEVKEGLLTMGCLPVEQTNFPPDYRGVAEMLEARIGECDAMVHIVGVRYGAEPDSSTLPAGTPRRSYTQLEADIARRLKKKLYVFVCPEDFPYDASAPETEEKAALQRAYREEVGHSPTLRTRVTDHEDMARRVRELQVDLEQIRDRLRRQGRRGVALACAFLLLLAGLAGVVWWYIHRTPSMLQETVKKTLQEALPANYSRAQVKANLEKEIRDRAAAETAPLDRVKDWRQISEIEKTRDQQLADVDRFLDQIDHAYEQQEASADYTLASQILAEKGVAEALAFLESKSAARESDIAALKQEQAATGDKLRAVLREKLLAASLLEKDLQFDQAEAQYRAVIADDPTWAEPRNALALLLLQRGAIVEPEKGNVMVREAVNLCRETLALIPQAQSPQDWATTQNYLGNALQEQGVRAEGAEAQRLLGEAVTAYQAALTVRTRAQWPQDWASTENNLGVAFWNQGSRAAGAEAQRLLGAAVAAFRAALQVRTREQWPQDWATTQDYLGNALQDQGQRAAGAEAQRLLGESVTAYQAALTVRTREQWPQEWASTQDNLASAFRLQGERAEGAEAQRLLAAAVAAFGEALRVYTREQWPQDWARTQINLGNALLNEGEIAEGAAGQGLMGQAVTAYRAALQVSTREQLPQQWAMIQNNLGSALRNQGERAEDAEALPLLGESVTAYRAALEVRTQAQLPKDWATTENNLANALRSQGEHTAGPDAQRLLGEAVAADRAALQVFTREQFPSYWAGSQGGLSSALKELAQLTGGEEGQKQQAEAEAIDREVAAAAGK